MNDFDMQRLEYMADRFNPLPTGDEFLDYRYEWQSINNGVEWPYYRFFYHLSQMLRPKLIVELGGWQGTAAAHFAAGCPDCTVLTIDHHSDKGDEAHKEKMLAAQKRYPNLKYLQGWTTPILARAEVGKHYLANMPDVLEHVYKEVEETGRIDILFIDSWHQYHYARSDWDFYSPLLNNPALVICDDIIEDGKPGDPIHGMMKFWAEMPEPKFLNSNLHKGSRIGFVKYK